MIIILEKEDLQRKVDHIGQAQYNYTLPKKVFMRASSVYVVDGLNIKTLKHKNVRRILKMKTLAHLLKWIMDELQISFQKSVPIMAQEVQPKAVARTLTQIEADAFERSA